MRRRAWMLLSAASLLTACGDADSTDSRGYTKAPLEEAGVFPNAEVRSDVARFGQPNRPVPVVITLPDSAQS